MMPHTGPNLNIPSDWHTNRRIALDSRTMADSGNADSVSVGHGHTLVPTPSCLRSWLSSDSRRHQLSAVLFAVTSVSFLGATGYWPDQFSSELHLLRGSFLTILLFYLFLLNILGWRVGNVNYVKMFELDSDGTVWNSIAGISMQTGAMWSVGAIGTLSLGLLHWNSAMSYVPLLLWPLLVCYFVWPLNTYFHESRLWMLNVIYRILVSPMYHVSFADFWVADQLNSLAIVLLDFEYSVCFLASLGPHSVADVKELSLCTNTAWGPRQVLACLPAWWRFAQCLRCYYDTKGIAHLLNAGKYFSTFPMIAATALLVTTQTQHPTDWRSQPEFNIWFLCTFGRTIYVFTWDVVMDWGFLQRPHNSFKSKHPFLRTHLLFPVMWVYYAMIAVDLVLRFTFLVKWSPVMSSLLSPAIMATLLATLEVVRRFLWNFFRLEYEQTKGLPPESPVVKSRPLITSIQSSAHQL